MREHFKDPYVIQAQKAGYRSRAVFKLLEIQARDKLLRPNMVVIDLGAAPGGWSQVVSDLIGEKGKIFALDCLMMQPLPDVTFIQGDFTDPEVIEKLKQQIFPEQPDLIISDMAPNMSGMSQVDQPKAMYLAESAWFFAEQVLKPGGSFLVKVFQGVGFDQFLQTLRKAFDKVCIRKPKASRQRSKEIYLLAKHLKRKVD